MKAYKNSLLYGSMVLSFGAVGAKIIGAVYRVFLTNIIGSHGIGLYQLVFPYYVLLLTVSSTGLPQAISSLCAEKFKRGDEESAKKIFLTARRSLFLFGILFSLTLIVFSKGFAELLQQPTLRSSFLAIAPSILLVSLISVYRGFFAAKYDMMPTAVSQILEQVFKALFCIGFALLAMPNLHLAVTLAIFSVTISEAVALLYLVIKHKKKRYSFKGISFEKGEFGGIFLSIYKLAIPLTLSALLLPFSQIVDGILVVKIINRYADGTMLYGLLTGAVFSLASLPICVCSSVSTCTIPKLAGEEERKKIIKKSLLLTLLLSVAAATGLFIFSDFAINLLYFKLPSSERILTANLLKAYCPSVILLSMMTTTVAILVAQKKAYFPCFSMLAATIVKVILNIILFKNQSIGIFGAVISQSVCFLIAMLSNLIYIRKTNR